MSARLAEADRERAAARDLGAVVVINDDLETAVAEVLDLIGMRRQGDPHGAA